MITDEEVERALDYLRDQGAVSAQKKANRIFMEEYRKVVKANGMKQHLDKPLAAQEREAYSHPDYLAHLRVMETAIEEDEAARWMMIAAQAKIEAWRTQQANRRGEAKIG